MSSITTANNADDDNRPTAPATPVEDNYTPNTATAHEVGYDNQEPWGFVNQPQVLEDVNEDEVLSSHFFIACWVVLQCL